MPKVMPRGRDRRHMRAGGDPRNDVAHSYPPEGRHATRSPGSPAGCLDSRAGQRSRQHCEDRLGICARVGRGCQGFQGHSYAAPPVGELRWRAPQPVKPWDSIRVSKTFSCHARSRRAPFRRRRWAKIALPSTSGRPRAQVERAAAGARVDLRAADSLRARARLACTTGSALPVLGVVIVSFNYRLGILGFSGASGSQQGVAASRVGQLRAARYRGGVAGCSGTRRPSGAILAMSRSGASRPAVPP